MFNRIVVRNMLVGWALLIACVIGALYVVPASGVTLEQIEAKRVVLVQTQAELDSLTSLSYAEAFQTALDTSATAQDSLLAAYGVTVQIAPLRAESGMRDFDGVLITVPVATWGALPQALWAIQEAQLRLDRYATGQYVAIRYEVPNTLSAIAAFITANLEE